jgi:hypothetical protein
MKLQKFQMYDAKYFKGLISAENHLGAIFRRQPQKIGGNMVQLLAYNRGKSLEETLSQFPTLVLESDDEFTWELIGSSARNIQLVEARVGSATVTAATFNVGAGGSSFKLVFGEDWFADGDVIVGEKNEVYPLRILGEASFEGTNAVYTVELMGVNPNGMPGEELVSGKRFSKEFSPVESEGSRKVGDLHFASPLAMRNEFSHLRIQHKVYGSMLKRKVVAPIPVTPVDGGAPKLFPMWMHYVDYQLEAEFSADKNRLLMFARSNRDEWGQYANVGKSGNVIKQGAGIREQMEVSYTHYYSVFKLKVIEDALYQLSESKLGMDNRTFILKTGERGAAQFHKACQEIASGWHSFGYLGGNAANPAIIQKTSSNLHDNSLSFGYQFVEYKAPNGVVIKVEVDPMYDDKVRNKQYKDNDPSKGVAESYRYDIFYSGKLDGGLGAPNIQIVKIRGYEGDFRGYQSGPFANPFTGAENIQYASTDEDAAVVHKKAVLGAIVRDPSRCITIKPYDLAV